MFRVRGDNRTAWTQDFIMGFMGWEELENSGCSSQGFGESHAQAKCRSWKHVTCRRTACMCGTPDHVPTFH